MSPVLIDGLLANGALQAKARIRGKRPNPELPTKIAQLFSIGHRGQVWVGGMPTLPRIRAGHFRRCPDFDLQISALTCEPHTNSIYPDGKERGVCFEGTPERPCAYMEIPVNRVDKRIKGVLDNLDFIIDLLRRGGNVYVHCMTGISRSIFVSAILCSHVHCESVEESMLRILALRSTDVYHPTANPHGRSGIRHDRGQETATFQEQVWVQRVCEAPVHPLPPNGMYMVSKKLSPDQRMVHACPEAGYPICYMKKRDRCMRGPCEVADTEAEAMVQLGSRLCRECEKQLDILSVSRLHIAGFSVQMSWRTT